MLDLDVQPMPSQALSLASPPIPTVAVALGLVEQWTDLSPTRRRDLASALNSLSRFAGLPPTNVLLSPAAVSRVLMRGTGKTYDVQDSRMRNVRSCVRYVMRRLDLIDPAGSALCPAWAALLAPLDRHQRNGLIGLARFCSGAGITPDMMQDTTIDDFAAYLASRTLADRPRKAAGAARGAWNRAVQAIPGWPQRRLQSTKDKSRYQLPLVAFPESFQDDVAVFRRGMAGTSLRATPLTSTAAGGNGRLRSGSGHAGPRRAATVATRTDHLRWAASALVASGVAIETITSLACLVRPLENARRILVFLHDRAGGKPSTGAMHVGEVLLIIARHYAPLPPDEIDELKAWASEVRVEYRGMTEKNRRGVAAAVEPHRYTALLNLPRGLLAAAQRLRESSPGRAAGLAMRAVAVALLTRCPLRLDDIIGLRLDQHLQRPSPRRPMSHLCIPAEETKNSMEIFMPVAPELARVLEVWISTFRPLIAMPGNPYLFPGQDSASRPITPQALREAVKRCTAEHVGVAVNPHRFRHIAAKVYLEAFPGEYETVRQLLGHRSLATTVRHYAGIEIESAMRRYDQILSGQHLQQRKAQRAHPAVTRPASKGR